MIVLVWGYTLVYTVRMNSNACASCGSSISRRATRCKPCVNRLRWQGDDPRRAKLVGRNVSGRNGHLPYEDREWLRSRYEDGGMSIRKVAAEAGCGLRTIARWMGIHGIPTRDNVTAIRMTVRRGPKSIPPCPECGATRRNRSHGVVCAACSFKHRGGERSSNWKGIADVMVLVRGWFAEHWRPRVFALDRYTCQECGDARGGNLHAHHRIPVAQMVADRRERWSPDLSSARGRAAFVRRLLRDHEFTSVVNGVTLCAPCHRRGHAKNAA